MNYNLTSFSKITEGTQDYIYTFALIVFVFLVVFLIFLKDKKLRYIAGHFKVLFEYHEGEKLFRERIPYCIKEYTYCGFTLFLVIFAILYGIRTPSLSQEITIEPIPELRSVAIFSLASSFSILYLIRALATVTIYYNEHEYKEAKRTAQRFIFGLVSIMLFGSVFSMVRLTPYFLVVISNVISNIENWSFTVKIEGHSLVLILEGIVSFSIGLLSLILITGVFLELVLEFLFPKFGYTRIKHPRE